MAEHPLIFNSEMVRAILDDRKTQTRRVPIERYRNWKVGDTIWVKEDYKYIIQGDMVITYYKCSFKDNRVDYTPLNYLPEKTRIKLIKGKQGVWKSKLLMFKFMARIWREITGLRVERVQNISWEDILAEGCNVKKPIGDPAIDDFTAGVEVIDTFHWFWDFINAKRHKGIYAWDKNPNLKVIEFKQTQLRKLSKDVQKRTVN